MIAIIGPDKGIILKTVIHSTSIIIFLISTWKHVMGTHWKHLSEVLLMSTNNYVFMEK